MKAACKITGGVLLALVLVAFPAPAAPPPAHGMHSTRRPVSRRRRL